jgi:hypothetical protein
LTGANERGGIVTDYTGGFEQGEAFKTADAHCRRYGRVARITGTPGDQMTFDCVAP